MKKRYYQCIATPRAPLCLSNGQAEHTDSDVMLDARDIPFLPATSIAGVLRAQLKTENDRNALFGSIDDKSNTTQSSVIVYDGILMPAETATKHEPLFRKYQRDGVGLDAHKNTIDSAKYDFEIIETKNSHFVFYLECTDETAAQRLKTLLQTLMVTGISFGGKTTRGFGAMGLCVATVSFDLSKPTERDAWLDFSPFTANAVWNVLQASPSQDSILLKATFALDGSFAVRQYATNKTEGNASDFAPVQNFAGQAVIPGTSWAGVFRHRMERLAKEANILRAPQTSETEAQNLSANLETETDTFYAAALFGSDGAYDKAQDAMTETPTRSRLVFSESPIEGGSQITRTRTAIERVTAGAANSKLFTSTVQYRGSTTLEIRLTSGELSATEKQLLAATLLDLHHGFATVGGQGGIGHGLIRLNALQANGKDVLKQLTECNLNIFDAATGATSIANGGAIE